MPGRQPSPVELAAARVEAAVNHATLGDYDPGDFGGYATHVAKAAGQQLDPFTEIGTTGLRQYGGYVLEEWLAQLAGRKAAWVWREMLDNDPVVGAVMFAIKWLARGVEWSVDEGADPAAAEFVEECMHDMSHTWGDFISEGLSMLPYGWALHEEVYKRRQGPQPDPPWNETNDGPYTSEDDSHPASSKYTDGRIGWRKLPVRAQETLLRWGFDGYSGIRYMEQIDWHGGQHKVPLAKSLLFRTQTTRNNPEGRSILRNAYTSYYALKNIKQIEAIGVERDLAGIPVMTPPDGINLFAAGNSALLAKVQKMVTAVRRDEYEGIVLPSAGWKFELLSAAGSRQFDTDKVVRRYRADIALSMLADFVLIGQDAVGSFAMVEVKSDLFGVALDGIFDLMCEVVNSYSIPRLLKLNGMPTDDPPTIRHGSARKIDLDRVGAFLQAISMAGAPIPWSMELLTALFTDAGLPAAFEEYKPATDLPGQKPDPMDLTGKEAVNVMEGGPAGAPGGPESGDEPAKPEPVQKAEHRKIPQGTIVDVQPALQQRARILAHQLDQEIAAALSELGEHAATGYSTIATKALDGGAIHRLVGRVMRSLNVQAWIDGRLKPILRNHAARVTADTQRTLQTEIGLEVHIADEHAQQIADQAGNHLGMRDIQPQVRQAILQAIRQGLANGDNPTKTAQRIRDLVPAGRF
ncbi:MAG TPA: hypothetical protein VMD48_07915, partial [Solirubrobacteraceae bacterium]|nr:hypothetical protein [Solirubrobacteraceae bacterium]